MCEQFAPSTAKSKFPMNYTRLTQNKRYQIYIFSKAGHKQNEIAELLPNITRNQQQRHVTW
jgi:hypothetical protein